MRAWMQSSDVSLMFLDACCLVEPGLSTEVRNLWSAFQDWSSELGFVSTIRRRDFKSRLGKNFQIAGSPQSIQGVYLKSFEDWEFYTEDDITQIYVITDGRLYKIGVSMDPPTRMRILQTGNGEKLHLLGAWPGSYELETHLHDRFARQRREGEWFSLTSDDLVTVQDMISQTLQ